MSNSTIKFNCLEIKQPIGKFYIGVINHKDLIEISYADVRRLEKQTRDVETYIGLQRPLSPKRVKEINKYVSLVDATFPTSIILSVSSSDATYNPETHVMEITRNSNVAKVLDGQHRIAGLEGANLGNEDFQINVVFYVDMELEDQAIVFATINKTQTKVNKSLVADLFDFAKDRSPQKTAHSIARALNEKNGSPFYQKIKILGTAINKEKETISQATFVESLIKYISPDATLDRDIYKRNKAPEKAEGKNQEKYFLRNLFLEEQDVKIAQIIWNYFDAVDTKWPNAWAGNIEGSLLNKSTGFIALMKFLKPAYLSFGKMNEVITKDEFSSIFTRISLSENSFSKENYNLGAGGQMKLYKELLEQSNLGNFA